MLKKIIIFSFLLSLLCCCNQQTSIKQGELQTGLNSYLHKDAIFSVNCGAAKPYTDQFNHAWSADQKWTDTSWGYLDGAAVIRKPAEIIDTKSDLLFLNERYALTAYRFPVAPGSYTVILYWAETYGKTMDENFRKFNVVLENKCVYENIDIYKETQSLRRPLIITFKVNVTDDYLDVEFDPVLQSTTISAVAVLRNE